MTALNKWQVKEIQDLLTGKYVRYEDVRIELTDHIASSIEAKIVESPDKTFKIALEEVVDDFGVGGFSKIVREKEKAMIRFWRKHFWQSLLGFLKLPLALWSIAIFSVSFSLQYALNTHLFSTAGIITIFGFIILLAIISGLKAKDLEIERFVFLKSYYSLAGYFVLMGLYLLPSSCFNFFEGESTVEYSLASVLFASFYVTFALISTYLLFFKIPQGLLNQMKLQYREYYAV